ALRCDLPPWEVAMPGVRHLPSVRRKLVAPGELGAVEPAARGEFPFSFGWQFLAGPVRIGERIPVSDLHDRMVVQPSDRAARAVRTPPVGAELELPPLPPVAQVDRVLRRDEYKRARFEHARQRAGIVPWVGRDLGGRDVA